MCVENKFTIHDAEDNCALLLFPLVPLFSRNAVSQGIVSHELSKIFLKGETKPTSCRKSFPEVQPSVKNSPSCLELQKQYDTRRQKRKIRELMKKRLTLITGLPVRQTQSESAFHLLVFFSVSVKVLPVTPLLSGVFVHRAFCAYFLRIERVVGNA